MSSTCSCPHRIPVADKRSIPVVELVAVAADENLGAVERLSTQDLTGAGLGEVLSSSGGEEVWRLVSEEQSKQKPVQTWGQEQLERPAPQGLPDDARRDERKPALV